MKKVNKHILSVFLVIALLAISTSVVFAKELGLLTISGPGIKGEVSLNDHDAMMNLEKSGFFDQASLAKPPRDLGEGYSITAHLNLDGDLVPFIQMVYYPTNEGESAYVHYTARLEGDALKPIDEWHLLNQKADSALRAVMTANKITVQSALVKAPEKAPDAVAPAKEPVSALAAEPVAAPVASLSAPLQPYLIPILVVGFLALTGLALVLRRRTVSHTT
ncbi:MAG TPA: hypothetical protein VFY83_14460 [Anaerolineales bacterium]|nr:hypothetical protein [Anaerolineales bacterium]